MTDNNPRTPPNKPAPKRSPAGSPAPGGPEPAGHHPDPAGAAAASAAVETERALANRRIARMRGALRERDARVRTLEDRLTALEESASMALGRVIAAAARRPLRGVVRLPRDLYRLWRRRRQSATTANVQGTAPGRGQRAAGSGKNRAHGGDATSGARAHALGLGADEDRLLLGPPGLTGDRMVIAGIFGTALETALSGCAHVVPLLPDNAPLVLDQVNPDLVVVDGTAGAAGGPWAYLGEPGMVDRERALLATLDAARDRGCPVVLWTGTASPPPGLSRLGWDTIQTGGPGIPLHRFNPIGWTGEVTTPLLVDPGLDRLRLAVQRSVRALVTALDAETVAAGVPNLPTVLRARGLTVAATPQQALEQLACGARVVCPPQVAADLGDAARFVRVSTGADGKEPAPPAGMRDDLRGVLRTLFAQYATPVRLAALADQLGIDVDPLHGRRVTVVAAVREVTQARQLVTTLLAQTHQPGELLLQTGNGSLDLVRAAVEELSAHDVGGIAVRAVPGSTPQAAAVSARSPWLAAWPRGPVPDTYLADLVCAAECSGADVVGPPAGLATTIPAGADPDGRHRTDGPGSGHGPGSPDGSGGLDGQRPPGPAGYAFSTEVDPALQRTELVRAGGGRAVPAARLLTLTPR